MRVFWEYTFAKGNHRPYPWEGMPVYYKDKSKWVLCSDSLSTSCTKLINPSGTDVNAVLGTYGNSTDKSFILPGEPDCPELTQELREVLQKQAKQWYLYTFTTETGWTQTYATPDEMNEKFLFLPSCLYKQRNRIFRLEEQQVATPTPGYCSCSSPKLKLIQYTSFSYNFCELCRQERQ